MTAYNRRNSGKRGVTREIVAEMTAKGLDPRTIALKLGLSVPGVHYHLKRLKAREEQEKQSA